MPVIPFAARWTIPEDQLIPLKDSINRYLFTSSVINIPGFYYYLAIYPNGDDDENRGQTRIVLDLDLENVKKVEADYTFLIESADYSSKILSIYEDSVGWTKAVCTTEDFFKPEMKFIVDGKCVIKVNGTFKYETADDPTSNAEQQKWDGAELGNELWEEEDVKDFTIIVDGKEIKVHKLLLRTRSDVFRAMFNPETKESMEHKVEITDFTFEVVEAAVKIIYNCDFTSSFTLDETMSLLQFYDKYQIPSLKDKVELLLINQISAATVCRLTNCSILTNSPNLKKKCIEFLMDSFSSKAPLSDIETLDKDIALEILRNSLFKDVETE